MSRRRRAVKREIYPDVQFGSRLVGRLVNTVMERGKRSVAQRIVYGAFDQIVENQEGTTALEVLERAVENAKPRLEVKSRRVGGATACVAATRLLLLLPPKPWRSGGSYNLPNPAKAPLWGTPWPRKLWKPMKAKEAPFGGATKCTEWRRRTRHSPTSAGRTICR